jgi:transcriptional regulator with XRE-family HTH domain
MNFGTTVVVIRKEKKLSQTDLAEKLVIHKIVLGRYERNEVSPFVDIAKNIADILDVSLDFLVGKTQVEFDKNVQRRILEVSMFDNQEREHIFSVIDAFITKRKIESIFN